MKGIWRGNCAGAGLRSPPGSSVAFMQRSYQISGAATRVITAVGMARVPRETAAAPPRGQLSGIRALAPWHAGCSGSHRRPTIRPREMPMQTIDNQQLATMTGGNYYYYPAPACHVPPGARAFYGP